MTSIGGSIAALLRALPWCGSVIHRCSLRPQCWRPWRRFCSRAGWQAGLQNRISDVLLKSLQRKPLPPGLAGANDNLPQARGIHPQNRTDARGESRRRSPGSEESRLAVLHDLRDSSRWKSYDRNTGGKRLDDHSRCGIDVRGGDNQQIESGENRTDVVLRSDELNGQRRAASFTASKYSGPENSGAPATIKRQSGNSAARIRMAAVNSI